jgi:translation initiation factor 1
MEKKGRGGKTVTVVYGLPQNAEFLKELSQELKRACGTGGTVVDGGVELQGDLRPRVRDVLAQRGYIVKG